MSSVEILDICCCILDPSLTIRSEMEHDDIKSTNRATHHTRSGNIGFTMRGNSPLCCQSPLSISIKDKTVKHQHKAMFSHSEIQTFSFLSRQIATSYFFLTFSPISINLNQRTEEIKIEGIESFGNVSRVG